MKKGVHTYIYRICTYIYVHPIDFLLYTWSTREETFTLDAEESEAAAGAAGGAASLRTKMDSGSKEREIREGESGDGSKAKRRACA